MTGSHGTASKAMKHEGQFNTLKI